MSFGEKANECEINTELNSQTLPVKLLVNLPHLQTVKVNFCIVHKIPDAVQCHGVG